MLVTLPHGLLDGVDLFNVVEIDELRGKQQNYLIDKDLVINNIGHVPKILEDMIKSFQTPTGMPWKGKVSDAIWKLTSGDIDTILIKIREKTYGPRYFHEATCPHCDHTTKNLELKLDELQLTPLSLEEQLKPKVIFLPKAQVEVELKPIYLSDLMESVEIMTTKQKTLITAFLSVSIKRIGNKSPITEDDIANLYATDIEVIRDTAEELVLDGSIDTDIEVTCSNKKCKKDYKLKLNCYEPSFFAHTRG
jgi:hypothetical protein